MTKLRKILKFSEISKIAKVSKFLQRSAKCEILALTHFLPKRLQLYTIALQSGQSERCHYFFRLRKLFRQSKLSCEKCNFQ